MTLKPVNKLIFDRSNSDILAAKSLIQRMIDGSANAEDKEAWESGSIRGVWTHRTLNRVEAWTEYLNNLLADNGYNTNIGIVKTDWSASDYLYLSDQERIRENIEALRNAFHDLPDWTEIIHTETMDYKQANALEEDLNILCKWLEAMIYEEEFRQANTLLMQAGVSL